MNYSAVQCTQPKLSNFHSVVAKRVAVSLYASCSCPRRRKCQLRSNHKGGVVYGLFKIFWVYLHLLLKHTISIYEIYKRIPYKNISFATTIMHNL
jgi:hypothetical protein